MCDDELSTVFRHTYPVTRAAAEQAEAVAERRLGELEAQLEGALAEKDQLQQQLRSGSDEVADKLTAMQVRHRARLGASRSGSVTGLPAVCRRVIESWYS